MEMERKDVTKETFGEWMNLAKRFDRLGKREQSAECALAAKEVAQKFPDLVCEGQPMPAQLVAQLDILCAGAPREAWELLGEHEGRKVYVDSALFYKDNGKPADVVGCFCQMTEDIRANLTWDNPTIAATAK